MKAFSTKAQKEQGGDLLVTPTPELVAAAIAKRQSVMAVAMDIGYTQIAEALPEVLGAVIEKAKDGNMTAAKLLLDRIIPAQAVGESDKTDKAVHVNITVTSSEPRPIGDIFDGQTIQRENAGQSRRQ